MFIESLILLGLVYVIALYGLRPYITPYVNEEWSKGKRFLLQYGTPYVVVVAYYHFEKIVGGQNLLDEDAASLLLQVLSLIALFGFLFLFVRFGINIAEQLGWNGLGKTILGILAFVFSIAYVADDMWSMIYYRRGPTLFFEGTLLFGSIVVLLFLLLFAGSFRYWSKKHEKGRAQTFSLLGIAILALYSMFYPYWNEGFHLAILLVSLVYLYVSYRTLFSQMSRRMQSFMAMLLTVCLLNFLVTYSMVQNVFKWTTTG